ncbi:MAG: hypothetical protein JWO86_416 [Myxococcaceae bacterium]|nr:hypothetical protein [Myxococcaceae bacterium]
MAMKPDTMKRLRSVLKIGAPLVAILTLMIGLRVGAGEAVRAAVVFGAPPGHPAPDGKTRLAWQILTFVDDRGVKETVPVGALTVIARSKGHEARWSGASNGDGVAEVALEMEGLAFGDPIELEVRAKDEKAPLAAGMATWGEPKAERSTTTANGGYARPTVRNGIVGLDVVIEGERLIAGFPTSVWVHATTPPGIASVGLPMEADPEPGLLASKEKTTTCGAGWAEVAMTAQAHVTGSAFMAYRPRGAGAGAEAEAGAGAEANASADAGADAGRGGGGGTRMPVGRWFGALPVAAGAFFISVPRALEANKAETAVLIAPNPRDVVYAELDDTRGRVVAGALAVVTEKGEPTPRARFELPPLAAGVYWLVVSGEPRGAEHMAGAAVSRTIVVGDVPGVDVHDACSLGPWVAQRPATGFPRWIALDGLPVRSAENRSRHLIGLLIGVLSLLAAGILETLLLVAASREARVSLQLAELDEDDPSAAKVTAKTPGGGLVVAVLIVVMGLALLAVLLIAKG